jgi:AcrR family transcriptional regulator
MDFVVLRGCFRRSGDFRREALLRKRPDLLAGEKLPRSPQQKRSIENRARLKVAALCLFGERGYEGTSIGAIAARARLATGGFYLHFRSKRQLLLVLMEELLEGLSRIDLDPAPNSEGRATVAQNPQQALRELLARAFSKDLAYLGACRAWREAVLSDRELARREKQIHAWTAARTKQARWIVSCGVCSGKLPEFRART